MSERYTFEESGNSLRELVEEADLIEKRPNTPKSKKINFKH